MRVLHSLYVIPAILLAADAPGATAGTTAGVRVTSDSCRSEARDAPGNVLDGILADDGRWVSRGKRGVTDGSDPHQLTLEFDAPVAFDEVRLFTGFGADPRSVLYRYALECERDGRWIEILRVPENRLLNPIHRFPVVETRRIRIVIPQGGIDDSFARIKEIQLRRGGRQVVPAASADQRRFFRAPPIRGDEDAFCRRAYRILLRGSRFMRDLYREWPVEPDCGYLGWGGHGEKEIMANLGMASLYAFVTSFGRYDPGVAGVPAEEARRRARGVVRYACHTHFTGPHPCVDGRHWGAGWHDSSWSTVLAQTVWLLWEDLDPETQEMAVRVIAADADRFIRSDPPSGRIDNTQAESNAWSARSPAIASVLLERHPRADAWRTACIRYLMNSLSVAADRTDETIVDGRPVKEWVTTENVHPDFTLENHGIVYPVYMWSSMVNICQSAGYFICAGRTPPGATFHHMRDVYEVYKQLQTWEGLPAYINGSDKFLHLQVVDILVHSFFAQALGDGEAAHLEDVELGILERMQARFDDGRLYPAEEVGPWARVNNLSYVLGTSYLLHLALRNDVRPVEPAAFERRIAGVRYFPDGKFILHRTPEKLVSFAWSKPHRVMGLAIPRDGSWLVTPYARGFVGTVVAAGEAGEPPMELVSLVHDRGEDSFTVRAIALRCEGRVAHEWTFQSPRGSDVLMTETLTARRPVRLDRVETGTIGIGRELGRETVALEWAGGRRLAGGLTGGDDELFELEGGTLTVGGRFAYTWKGRGTVCYLKRNRPARVHGAPGGYGHLEDLLFIRHLESPRDFAAGDVIASGTLRIHR
ncbi:MAG: hypothetical protein JXP34_27265 [Planctomycetes bacterium]|nr:hypothetical protein [Planctomycetota bacterium]